MSSPDSPRPSDHDDPAEVDRLKRELAELRASQPSPEPGSRRGWWRPVVATLLITIAALLAPVSVLASWARDQVGDTDRYIETVAPLADDPAVQAAIAKRIEEIVFSYLDVEAATQQLVDALAAQDLPPRVEVTLRAAAGPLASGIRNFVSDRILNLVQSDAFADAWVQANRVAHSQMVAVLTGEGGSSVQIEDGMVAVNVAALISAVKEQLTEDGFAIAARIPEVNATFTIVESKDLAKAQGLFQLLDDLATWLPVVGLLLIAVAILISRNRRKTTMAAGIAVAGAMLLLGAILNIARPLYLDALPETASPEAAAAIYDQLVSFIRLALRAVLVVALTVAVVAWLFAPTGSGAAVRRGLSRGVGGLRSGRSRAGLHTGAFGAALAEYRNPIRIGVVAIAALLYVLQSHPTGATALTFVVVTAVLLILLEVLAAEPAEPEPPAEAESTPAEKVSS